MGKGNCQKTEARVRSIVKKGHISYYYIVKTLFITYDKWKYCNG